MGTIPPILITNICCFLWHVVHTNCPLRRGLAAQESACTQEAQLFCVGNPSNVDLEALRGSANRRVRLFVRVPMPVPVFGARR